MLFFVTTKCLIWAKPNKFSVFGLIEHYFLAFKSTLGLVAEIEIKLCILDRRAPIWSSQSSISVELVKLGLYLMSGAEAAKISFIA